MFVVAVVAAGLGPPSAVVVGCSRAPVVAAALLVARTRPLADDHSGTDHDAGADQHDSAHGSADEHDATHDGAAHHSADDSTADDLDAAEQYGTAQLGGSDQQRTAHVELDGPARETAAQVNRVSGTDRWHRADGSTT